MRDNVVIGYEDGYCIVIDEENKRMKIFCGKERPYEVGTTPVSYTHLLLM